MPSARFTLLTASLVCALIILDTNIVAVSLPSIARDLSGSFADIEWVVSAYLLAFAPACCPPAAWPTVLAGGACCCSAWCCSVWPRWRVVPRPTCCSLTWPGPPRVLGLRCC